MIALARRSDTARSDIDVMVVGEVGFAEVVNAVYPVQEQLGREVNPTVYSPVALAKRIKIDNDFIQRVMEQTKIWLIAGEDGLSA